MRIIGPLAKMPGLLDKVEALSQPDCRERSVIEADKDLKTKLSELKGVNIHNQEGGEGARY